VAMRRQSLRRPNIISMRPRRPYLIQILPRRGTGLSRKHKPEEIIGKLREAEIALAQGGTVADACHPMGGTE
jgi:hypothetical protein